MDSNKGKKAKDNDRYRRGKTVDAVGQIDTVDHQIDHENGEQIIYRAKLHHNIGKGNMERRINIAEHTHQAKVEDADRHLKDRFLIRLETLVLLLHELAEIVHKADHSVCHGKCHRQRQRNEL